MGRIQIEEVGRSGFLQEGSTCPGEKACLDLFCFVIHPIALPSAACCIYDKDRMSPWAIPEAVMTDMIEVQKRLEGLKREYLD